MQKLFTFTRHNSDDQIAVQPEDVNSLMELDGECFVYANANKEGLHAQENFEVLTARWEEALGVGAKTAKPAKTRGRRK